MKVTLFWAAEHAVPWFRDESLRCSAQWGSHEALTVPKLEFPIYRQIKFDRKCHVSNALNDHGGIFCPIIYHHGHFMHRKHDTSFQISSDGK